MKHSDKKILYVEDEFIIRNSIVKIIEDRFESECIYTASNGVAGLESFIKNSPDLVITDMKMDKMCGDEMVINIRELNTTVPIIIVSAYDSHIYTSIQNQNITDYIIKPVGKFNLLYKIERSLYGN